MNPTTSRQDSPLAPGPPPTAAPLDEGAAAQEPAMLDLLANPEFAARYARLADVSLNPRRHTAAHAHAHSEAVAAMARRLAVANGCTAAEVALLGELGRAHDIGKITGTARPERSLEVLAECGITEPALLALVRWHDTSLPWWKSAQRGQPVGDKAWRRMAAEVDVRLLCLFMVADRVDAPGGWRRNLPTSWFHDQARSRGLLGELVVELADHPSEISAGAAVVADVDGARRVLVIKVRAAGWELPKGGLEWDELPEEAAVRETREEAGVTGELVVGAGLGHLDYDAGGHRKRVRYWRLTAPRPVALGPRPDGTRAVAWLSAGEVETAPLIDEALRPILRRALT